MPFRTLVLFLAAATFAALTPALALAAPGGGTPLFAGYWGEFLDHWGGMFQKQNGVVMGALVLGALCLFIITRGKWKK